MSITRFSSTSSLDRLVSWTDDLPICNESGVGEARSEIYLRQGTRQDDHPSEDRSFHYVLGEGPALYGVVDGFDGSQVAHFAAERFPAELLLGQLDRCKDDSDIKTVLSEAFKAVEQGFFESIGDHLANLTRYQMEFNTSDMSLQEACSKNPELYSQIADLTPKTAGGASAVLALIHQNKLHVASAGACRALLCEQLEDGPAVYQLTREHTTDNPSERHRLLNNGITEENLVQWAHDIQPRVPVTRCIADFTSKSGSENQQYFKTAKSNPCTAEPDISAAVDLADSSSFLLLASSGLIQTLQAALGVHQVNAELCRLTIQELNKQSTLAGVAQGVVHRISQLHHDRFMTTDQLQSRRQYERHEDMTLLVRNLNHPFPPDLPSKRCSSGDVQTLGATLRGTLGTTLLTDTIDASVKSSSSVEDSLPIPDQTETAKLDENGQIQAHVDLRAYEQYLSSMSEEEKLKVIDELIPKLTEIEGIPEVDGEAEA